MSIAICVVAYNRLYSLKRLLSSLSAAYYDNDQVTLIISIDKSSVYSVTEYALSFEWKHGDKRIISHPENLGLRKHILGCGELLDEFDALIVLEDDLFVSPGFYLFARQSVAKYKDDQRIAGISLYSFMINSQNQYPFIPVKKGGDDVFFMNYAQSWGQVWMKKQWQDFKRWYATHSNHLEYSTALPRMICSWSDSSWLKYHIKYCIEQNKYFVYPYTSLTTDFSDAGTHNPVQLDLMQVPLQSGICLTYRLPDLAENAVRYDGFFEFKSYVDLTNRLGISEDELCVDFYGEKQNVDHYRYWLTREVADYYLVESYALQMRPYEMNVLMRHWGTGLYLYDRTRPEPHAGKPGKVYLLFLTYIYNIKPIAYFKRICKYSKVGILLLRVRSWLKHKI